MNFEESASFLFRSYDRVTPNISGYDSQTRDLSGIKTLFAEADISTNLAPTITVTGSKGKGSIAILAAAMLEQAGHKVGLITSPSFLSLRERIRVNSRSISEEDFIRIVDDLKPHIERIDDGLPDQKYLSPTGLFLACALVYFREMQVTSMVLEVGRGGRFDDVSIVQNEVACITLIMDEHLDKLGPTKLDIAWHKTGVIKPKSSVVSSLQDPEVEQYMRQQCRSLDAKLFELDRDFAYSQHVEGFSQTVHIELNALDRSTDLALSTPAWYQGMNSALAFVSAYLIDQSVVSGLASADSLIRRLRFPGRCDIINDHEPRVIVDGAINRESANQFKRSARPFSNGNIVLVTALPEDKDYKGLLDELLPEVKQVIVTHVTASHLHFSNDVHDYAVKIKHGAIYERDVFKAFKIAINSADTIWVVGTQSLVRDALDFWGTSLETLYRQ